MKNSAHEDCMRLAIALARNNPRYPFGAVIVANETGTVLAEGWNQSAHNPIWHGEIVALNHLFARTPHIKCEQLSLYTTAEPCPMCQSALMWAGMSRVVYGTSIETLKTFGWQQIDIRAADIVRHSPFHNCLMTGGVLEKECDALFKHAPTHREVGV